MQSVVHDEAMFELKRNVVDKKIPTFRWSRKEVSLMRAYILIATCIAISLLAAEVRVWTGVSRLGG